MTQSVDTHAHCLRAAEEGTKDVVEGYHRPHHQGDRPKHKNQNILDDDWFAQTALEDLEVEDARENERKSRRTQSANESSDEAEERNAEANLDGASCQQSREHGHSAFME